MLSNNGVTITLDKFVSEYVNKYINLSEEELKEKSHGINIDGNSTAMAAVKIAFTDAQIGRAHV